MMSLFRGRVRWAPGLSLAVLLGLSVAGCTSSGDDDDGEVQLVEGTIRGTVADSRGLPVADAVVSYYEPSAGEPISVNTGADGAFELSDVGIVAVSGPNANDVNGPITLSIEPPPGPQTLAATVEVGPLAQIGSVASNELFEKNFTVDTGVLRIPRLDQVVTGTLRNQQTGAPLPGEDLTLSFVAAQFSADTKEGVKLSYRATVNPGTQSDASGLFRFATAPNDSCLQLLVAGLALEGISGSVPQCTPGVPVSPDPNAEYFATTADPPEVALGSVFVSVPVDADAIAPVVAGVDGVVDANVSPAPLSSTITGVAPNGFTVRFSEPLQDLLSAQSVSASYGSDPATSVSVAGVTLTNNSVVTVNLSAPLPQGETVRLQFVREDLQDLAGNIVALSREIAYDSLDGNAGELLTLTFGVPGTADSTPPFVSGVTGVIDPDENPATLSSEISGVPPNELVVAFSEAVVDDIAASDVNIALDDGEAAVLDSIALSDGGTRLHLALADPLPAGADLTIALRRAAFVDMAGNSLAPSSGIAYDGVIGTGNETLTLALRTAPGDTEAPVVEAVDGVIDPTVSPAPLSSDITTRLTLRFSEPLQNLMGTQDVAVTFGADQQQTVLTVAAVALSGNVFTIDLATALPSGETISVQLARQAFRDLAGNVVGLSAGIAYDSYSGGSSEVLTLTLGTFSSLDLTPPFVSQVVGVLDSGVSPAPLAPGIDGVPPNEFVIEFSEPMQNLVRVSDVSATENPRILPRSAPVASVVLSEDGLQLRIALAEAVEAGAEVTLYIARDRLVDEAGNPAALNGDIEYDAFAGTGQSLLALALDTTPL